jgi:hypothetical protein
VQRLNKLIPLDLQLRITAQLTIFDLIITLLWIGFGFATEANPILNQALSHGVQWFILSKLGLGLGSLWILYRFQSYKLARLIIPGIFITYIWLTIYHILGFIYFIKFQSLLLS